MEQKGLTLVTTKRGEIMWVHSDLLKNEQWFSSSAQRKMQTSNTIPANLKEEYIVVNALIDSEEEA